MIQSVPRGSRALAAALLILAAGPGARAQAVISPRGDYAPIAARLEQYIAAAMRRDGLPALSIALVVDQDIVWARGFGLARISDSTPATAETVYRVGSVSKLFTDLAIMQRVERRELDLDAPASRYAPELRPRNPYAGAPTLRQLMSHRAGLVREPPLGSYFDSAPPSLAATIASLGRTTLVYPPGTRTKYSNAGIAAVGYVLERAAGEPFPRVLEEAVLEPLGMRASAFAPTPALAAKLAEARMWTLDGRVFPAPRFELGIAPAGSMYATVGDLGRFMSALFAGGRGSSGPVVSAATIDTMWTPQYAPAGSSTGYGIGFRLARFDGHRSVGHDGAIYGFATALRALPDEKLGVVVATTLDGANAAVDRIAERALRELLARRAGASAAPVPPESSTPVDTGRVNALVARYASRRDPALRTVEIVHRGRGVAVLPSPGGGAPALRARGDTLLVEDPVFGDGQRYRPVRHGDTVVALVADGEVPDTLWRAPTTLPAAAPSRLRALVGEYGPDYDVLYIHERDGKLWALIEWFFPYPLTEVGKDTFAFPPYGLYDGEQLVFTRDRAGRVTGVRAAGVRFDRRAIEPRPGTNQLRITPLRPVRELRAEALTASPPAEPGAFKPADLVELRTLDPSIKLEVRYATSNNFLGTRIYEEARAFMQRPAAEALVRAHRALAKNGYGLLIHDAYRPWYVTKIFWDATPPAKKWLVADPSQGSKHNRGAAVDLTLYDLVTGRPVEMVSTYDESTDRAYADYLGGTTRQRWLRELLRQAMEREGFTVNPQEWWHFDHADWKSYRIGNVPFSKISRGGR